MVLTDVIVLVYALREDTPEHPRYRRWLEETINSPRAYVVSNLVLSGFVRVVTHPRVFAEPSPLEAALGFVADVRDRPNAVPLAPGRRHWGIFLDLLEVSGATGNQVPDA